MIPDSVNSHYGALGLALQQPAAKNSELGQAEFLQLMTAQLKFQDPLKPLENSEFLGQIAQFSTVSGIQSMERSMSQLSTSLQSNQALQAAGLVGKGVLVPSTEAYLFGEGGLNASAKLPGSGQLVVDITDGGGNVVRRLDLGQNSAGQVPFEWDGLDASGQRLPAGTYTLKAHLVQGSATQDVSTYAVGLVNSVSIDGTNLSLDLYGMGNVDFDDVIQIL